MSLEILPVVGIFAYMFLKGVLNGYVIKAGIAETKAFILGFIYPVVFILPLVFGGYIYREINNISYEQDNIIWIFIPLSIVLGVMQGFETRKTSKKHE